MGCRWCMLASIIVWAVSHLSGAPASLHRCFVLITNFDPVFGFATSDALIETKDTNAGLRDQRAALECMYLEAP
jgi:hypothetical protein